MNIQTPNRKKHTYTQTVHGAIDTVYSLLCPVEEAKWVPGWMPKLVISESGIAETESIFITKEKAQDAIWIINAYVPERHHIEMYKVTPEHTVGKLVINLNEENQVTLATISYEYTSLGPAGDKFLRQFTEDYYIQFMQKWEEAINHYLKTGTCLHS